MAAPTTDRAPDPGVPRVPRPPSGVVRPVPTPGQRIAAADPRRWWNPENSASGPWTTRFWVTRPWTAVALLVVNALVLGDIDVPLLRPLAAVWLLVGLPTRLLAAKVRWQGIGGTERLVLSFASALLGVLVWSLLLNTVLPLVGIQRALGAVPVLLAADAVVLGLLSWRPASSPSAVPLPRFGPRGLVLPWPPLDTGLVAAAATCTGLAVAGAVRLNNGGDGTVALLALVIEILVLAALLGTVNRVRDATVHLVVYLQACSLLLMTSLRGWSITGHDSQREYHVFQLTEQAAHWDVASLQDAYNACLSITILPTVLHALTGGAAEAVFKVWTQLAFATVPVVVYLLARRHSSKGTSLLGVVFFVAFPTFFTDMPFLNRQEIAFVFLAVAMLTVMLTEWSIARRRRVFGLLTLGVVLSHYSTTYVLVGVLVGVSVLRIGIGLVGERLPGQVRWLDRSSAYPDGRTRREKIVAGPANIVVLVVAAFVWSNLLTGTGGQLALTLRSTVTEILHPGSSDERSSDVTYNLFSRQRFDPEQRLEQYRTETLARTAAARDRGEYLPLATLDAHPALLTETAPLPLTRLGSALTGAGIDVAAVNAVLRSSAAKLLQVFVCVGLVALALRRAQRFRPSPELILLGVANFAVVVSQVVLPQVSVDYGVLRAFQQSLLVLAPFLATGAMACLRWARRWADPAAGVLALAFMTSLTGVMPQLTGGYPPQLHLNNAGLYYDIYYLHPQEVAAVDWLSDRADSVGGRFQFEVETDRYTSSRLQTRTTTSPDQDIFPTMLRTDSYVLLGYATVTRGVAVVTNAGDQLPYRYPLELLEETKNLMYDNGGAQVYR